MTLQTWIAFFAAAWVISLSPGAGAVSYMTAGIRHGSARYRSGTRASSGT